MYMPQTLTKQHLVNHVTSWPDD